MDKRGLRSDLKVSDHTITLKNITLLSFDLNRRYVEFSNLAAEVYQVGVGVIDGEHHAVAEVSIFECHASARGSNSTSVLMNISKRPSA